MTTLQCKVRSSAASFARFVQPLLGHWTAAGLARSIPIFPGFLPYSGSSRYSNKRLPTFQFNASLHALTLSSQTQDIHFLHVPRSVTRTAYQRLLGTLPNIVCISCSGPTYGHNANGNTTVFSFRETKFLLLPGMSMGRSQSFAPSVKWGCNFACQMSNGKGPVSGGRPGGIPHCRLLNSR